MVKVKTGTTVACLVLVALVVLVTALPVFAVEKKQEKKQLAAQTKTSVAPAKKEVDKQALIQQVRQDVVNLNTQQITVQVLGMQYQKELNALQQLQQQFCKTYELDLNKFQQGMYVFNEQEAKFVEQQPPAQQPQVAAQQ